MNNKLVFLLVLALFFSSSVFGASIIQIRRDTAANWTGANPILAQGEMGYEIDSLKLKFGDGVTNWNSLAYYSTATDVNGTDILPSSVSVDRNLSVRGDSNFSNLQADYLYGDGSGLTGITSTPDINGETVILEWLDIDGNLSVRGDANFVDIGFSSFIYGDGSKLTGLQLPADANNFFVQLQTAFDWDTNAQTACTNYADILGGTGLCIDLNINRYLASDVNTHFASILSPNILGDANFVNLEADYFYGDGSGITGITATSGWPADTTIDSNQTAFDSIQVDMNLMYCLIPDSNNASRLSYTVIADPIWQLTADANNYFVQLQTAFDWDTNAQTACTAATEFLGGTGLCIDVNTNRYMASDINTHFAPILSPTILGDANFASIEANNAYLTNLIVTGDFNAESIQVSGVSFADGGIQATGDSNFAGVGISTGLYTNRLNAIGDSNFASLQAENAWIDYNIYATDANFGGVKIPQVFNTITEPTGFPNRTDSTLGFVDATRVFTITGTNFPVYINGVEYLKNTENITVADGNGMHWIYYAADGTLSQDTTVPSFSLPLIATIYYNTGGGFDKGVLGEERHGMKMDGDTHALLHYTVGTRYESGLTGTFLDNTFDITEGIINDEDIAHAIGAETTCKVFYKDGAADFIWTTEQSEYYHEVGGTLQYNNGNALENAGVSNHVAYWVFATNDTTTPIYSLMGQRQDVTLANARINNTYESLTLGTLPFEEMKILYRVILKNVGGTTTYVETQDLRSVSNLPSGTYVATQHNVLSGLNWAQAGHTFDADLNVEEYSVKSFGDSNFLNAGISGNAYLNNLTVTGDFNVESISVSGVSFADGGISVTGDANFVNLQADYFYGDGAGLINVSTTADGFSPLVLPWADENVADDITVAWAGLTGVPYIPNEQDIDLNAMYWDTNATTVCDGNTVLTGDGTCQSIVGFHIQGAGSETLDTTIDSNQTAFDSVQVDLNLMYCQMPDSNNASRLSYAVIADPPWQLTADANNFFVQLQTAFDWDTNAQTACTAATEFLGGTGLCIDVNTNRYLASDINTHFLGYNGAVTDLNMGIYDINTAGDIQATYFYGDGSGLTNITSTADVNGEDVILNWVDIDGNISVAGNADFMGDLNISSGVNTGVGITADANKLCFPSDTCEMYIDYNGTSMIMGGS